MRTLRSWTFTAFMYAYALFIGVVCAPTLLRRDWALAVAQAWCRGILWGLRTICRVSSHITGQEYLPDGPAIIAGKHQSMWETVFFCAFFKKPTFILKKELRTIPVFGWWCEQSGFIFVDREAGASALRQMVHDAKAALADGATHIIIFPEGTRTALGTRTTYQPGIAALARSLRLPVVPAAHNSGCYWRHPGPEKAPGTIALKFLPPISPSTPRAQLMASLEEVVESTTRQLENQAYQATAPRPAPSQEEAA